VTAELTADEYLRVDDVEELPNGRATIVQVESPAGLRRKRCRIDQKGFLRTLDVDELFISSKWSVVDHDD
jgi:hypothetical protein